MRGGSSNSRVFLTFNVAGGGTLPPRLASSKAIPTPAIATTRAHKNVCVFDLFVPLLAAPSTFLDLLFDIRTTTAPLVREVLLHVASERECVKNL